MKVVSAPSWAAGKSERVAINGGGPSTVSDSRFASLRSSSVQTAPLARQSVVGGSVTVTSPGPSGSTTIRHVLSLPRVWREAPSMAPPVTSKAWSSSVR